MHTALGKCCIGVVADATAPKLPREVLWAPIRDGHRQAHTPQSTGNAPRDRKRWGTGGRTVAHQEESLNVPTFRPPFRRTRGYPRCSQTVDSEPLRPPLGLTRLPTRLHIGKIGDAEGKCCGERSRLPLCVANSRRSSCWGYLVVANTSEVFRLAGDQWGNGLRLQIGVWSWTKTPADSHSVVRPLEGLWRCVRDDVVGRRGGIADGRS